MTTRSLLITVAMVASSSSAPASAYCQCEVGGLTAVLPADGSTGQATTTAPLLTGDVVYYDPTFELASEDGTAVTWTSERLTTRGETLVRLTPSQELEPDVGYSLSARWAEHTFVEPLHADVLEFRTAAGGAGDTVSLEPPEWLSWTSSRGDDPDDWECGGSAPVQELVFEAREDAMIQVQLAENEDFLEAMAWVADVDGRVRIDGTCEGGGLQVDHGDEYWARARLLDASSNAGPWTEPTSHRVSQCATTNLPAALWWLTLVGTVFRCRR